MLKTLVSTALIAATFAAPAGAGQLKVAVADLNLATLPGQAELDRRLTVAIDRACGSADQRDLTEQADIRRCRETARMAAAPRRAAMIAAAASPQGDHGVLASR